MTWRRRPKIISVEISITTGKICFQRTKAVAQYKKTKHFRPVQLELDLQQVLLSIFIINLGDQTEAPLKNPQMPPNWGAGVARSMEETILIPGELGKSGILKLTR